MLLSLAVVEGALPKISSKAAEVEAVGAGVLLLVVGLPKMELSSSFTDIPPNRLLLDVVEGGSKADRSKLYFDSFLGLSSKADSFFVVAIVSYSFGAGGGID